MTENLAARGEGRAGLVAKWRKQADKLAGANHFGDRAKCKRDCADELETALEAAAPPSTPDVFDFVGRKMATHLVETMQALEGFAEPFRAAGQSALEEFWFRATGHHIDWDSLAPEVRAEHLTAALATPSPQALGPNCNKLRHGMGYSYCPGCPPENSVSPAATQEPAGSGGAHHKWPTVRNKRDLSGHSLCPICGHSHSEWGAAIAAMHEDAGAGTITVNQVTGPNGPFDMPGSPRKVGEDGASKCE